MNKKTKMLIGVGAIALVGYYFYNKSKNKSFANLTAGAYDLKCPCRTVKSTRDVQTTDGTTIVENTCFNDSPTRPHKCYESKD